MYTVIRVEAFGVGPNFDVARWDAYRQFADEALRKGVPAPIPVEVGHTSCERGFHRGDNAPADEAYAYVVEAVFTLPKAK